MIYAAAHNPAQGEIERNQITQTAEAKVEKDEWLKEAKQKIAEPDRKKLNETHRVITAFTSRWGEADRTECETAAGNICKQWDAGRKYTMCATRAFPIGTILRFKADRESFLHKDFPDGYIICEVIDRKNERFPNSIDIYFGHDGPVCRKTVGKPPKGMCLNHDEAFTINYTTLVEAWEGDGPVYYP